MPAGEAKPFPLVPVLLTGLILISFLLHFWRIGLPAEAIFDERHFADYALSIATGRPYVDIHPPLGKLLYASVLKLSGQDLSGQKPFLLIEKDEQNKTVYSPSGAAFAPGFPFRAMRGLASLFGILLPLAVFLFLKNIGVGDLGALLSAGLIVFDNALLLDSRLILLNGMYLALGFLSLALYFRKTGKAIPAGLVWGLALSVKSIAILFVLPVLIDWAIKSPSAEQNRKRKYLIKFIATGLGVYLLSYCLNWLGVSPRDQVLAWQNIGFLEKAPAAMEHLSGFASQLNLALFTWLTSLFFTVGGYTVGSPVTNPPHPWTSFWYEWPFGQKTMSLLDAGQTTQTGPIFLAGNPVIWFLVLISVIYLLAKAVLFIFRRKFSFSLLPESRLPLLLLGSYLGSLLIYATITRNTFLYHYFPALSFGIGLLGWLAEYLYRNLNLTVRLKRGLLVLLFISVVLGFIATAPKTYGL